jgi:hypothetical protein
MRLIRLWQFIGSPFLPSPLCDYSSSLYKIQMYTWTTMKRTKRIFVCLTIHPNWSKTVYSGLFRFGDNCALIILVNHFSHENGQRSN